MDCTAGYHQMPIAEHCQKYTTFTTKFGNYMWLRTPMGPSNAPSMYQKAMATEIFPQQIHQILEVYLDDIITWSHTIEELIKNLQIVFSRLRQFNVTLNPEKCRFGLTEVEYVGHLINEQGITFSDNKKELVANFVQPTDIGGLKTFVGIAGYFRRHIRGYAELVHPLNALCEGYDKKKKANKLEWNNTTSKAFTDTQNAIVNCQLLFFRDQSAPIRLYTDASDYGIGAYLCQIVDGEEQPIAFISKTLSKAEKKWSVYEKEAYAIFYSLRKWEHHLQDNKFTLFTDHKNLTYLNKDPSPKVMRWKVAVQEYDFSIAYIEGSKNVIADGFSRFCPKSLDADQEPPDRTIVMFLESYPMEEKEIDTKLFFLNGKEEVPRTIIHLYPELEWEGKRVISERDAEINLLKASYNTSEPLSKKPRQIDVACTAYLNSLLSVKETEYYHIPTQYYEIIGKCHNSKVGHWGLEGSITKVKEYLEQNEELYGDLVWHTIRKDVDNFIKKCPCCQLNRQKRFQIDTKQYTTSKFGLFKNLSIDAIYVPESKGHEKYILVIVDAASRYVRLVPLRDLSAESAARGLMNHMHQFGIPNEICTDNSSQFQSVFQETLKILSVHDYKIHPYSHQENSIVERENKEVLRHLRNFIFDSKVLNEWPNYLPQVEQIMNSHVSKSTGIAPVEMVFAGQIDLNQGKLFPNARNTNEEPMSEYMTRLLKQQSRLLEIASEHQNKTDMFHLAKKKGTDITEFPINSFVTAAWENDEHRPPTKLHNVRRGPFRVLNKTTREEGDVYTVLDLVTNKELSFHVKLLHPFQYDVMRTSIEEVATVEKQFFTVENVVTHRWKDEQLAMTQKGQNSNNLELLIKWAGYDIPEWNRYDDASIKKVQEVINYLELHNLKHLIPQQFRTNIGKRGRPPNKYRGYYKRQKSSSR